MKPPRLRPRTARPALVLRASAFAVALAVALAAAALADGSAPRPVAPPRVGPVPPGAAAPVERADAQPIRLEAFTLGHQSAGDALAIVRPLLSARGSVELQASANTLVVRDTLASLSRVVAALRAYDHPTREVPFEIEIVRADRAVLSPPPPSSVAPALLSDLKKLLRYETYTIVARAELRPREGEDVAYEIGSGYRVAFRLGTVIGGRRVRLAGFRVAEKRGAAERELLHANLNPFLDQPLILGLSRDESAAKALMVVVSFEEAARRP